MQKASDLILNVSENAT